MLVNFSCGSYPVRNYFNYVAIFAGHFADAGRILKGVIIKKYIQRQFKEITSQDWGGLLMVQWDIC
jgi:hypothetical protein